ncbi:MAG: ATP-binding cassette domain-containing protein, partial [Synergistaceae bacterium]|nr:ATP-binding cassette domain-containing protein [Synergistaceae bacterium]
MALIRVSGLTFSYGGGHGKIFDNVSFQFDTDWKLGLVGRNGRGKTTFLNLLMGRYEYYGTITAKTDFEYFPRPAASSGMDSLEAARAAYGNVEPWKLEREASLIGLPEDALRRPFEDLSGGEATKVLLAALFCGEERFLLIDEPTSHLDSEGREAVSRYLNSKKGFIL